MRFRVYSKHIFEEEFYDDYVNASSAQEATNTIRQLYNDEVYIIEISKVVNNWK